MKPALLILLIIILSSCNLTKVAWADNIHNPENQEFVQEVAFNKNISTCRVTQRMFNKRYNIKQ